MRSRPSLLFLLLTSLLLLVVAAATGAQEPPGRLDHYDPVSLNEMAMKKVREGDTGTAMLLLQRAVLLAPHESAIRRNLEMLQAWQAGQPLPSDAPPAPGATKALPVDAADASPPPFPLWPKRSAQ